MRPRVGRFDNDPRGFCSTRNTNHRARTAAEGVSTALSGRLAAARECRTDYGEGGPPCAGWGEGSCPPPKPHLRVRSSAGNSRNSSACLFPCRPGDGRSSCLLTKANLLPVDRAAHTPAAPTQSQASGRAEGRQGLSPKNWLVLMQLLKITTITQVHFKLRLPCPQCDFLQISKAMGMPPWLHHRTWRKQNLSCFHLLFCRERGLQSNCPVCGVLGTRNRMERKLWKSLQKLFSVGLQNERGWPAGDKKLFRG